MDRLDIGAGGGVHVFDGIETARWVGVAGIGQTVGAVGAGVVGAGAVTLGCTGGKY